MSLKTSDIRFKERIRIQIQDPIMRKAVANAQERIGTNRQKMVDELGHWEEWRSRAEQIRRHVLENLDAYLYQLSEKVTANGGHVYFARTREDATSYILKVAKEKNARKVVKSKSMVTEEIGMNAVLQKAGIPVIETDLGEYILQLAHEPPSHVVVPAIHKDRHQIRRVLHEHLGYDGPETPEAMTLFIREKIRQDFLSAEVGVTGCNFAVAETGSVCLVTNEGNARMCTTLPKTHIAVMGMERIAPTFQEVDVLITMLARSAVGAVITPGLQAPEKKDMLMVRKSSISLLLTMGVQRFSAQNSAMYCDVSAAVPALIPARLIVRLVGMVMVQSTRGQSARLFPHCLVDMKTLRIYPMPAHCALPAMGYVL